MSTKNCRLLVVDDFAEARSLLSQRLERKGLVVVEADGGDGALKHLAEQTFDLVLLDVNMPEINGLEVLRRIRTDPRLTSLPVIMVTANGANSEVVEALEGGANDYVTKPLDFPVVYARIETLLGRKLAEDSLRAANAELEARVLERTTALIQANQLLADEIEQRRESEALVRHLAYHDPLTNLGNRMLFYEQLTDAKGTLANAESLAVLCIDLDGFKYVNDTLGHHVGDGLLREVALRLRGCIDQTGVIARLGGDEFVLAQVMTSPREEAEKLAERIVEVLGLAYLIDGHQVVVSASVGIAIATLDSDSLTDLLRNADLALYRAKADGRGVYRFFRAEMNALIQARRQIETDLRKALRNGEFELLYQPLVNLKSNTVSGFEALIRWNHPVRGTVSPADFIPLAEEIGLMGPIGDWVLRQACREAATWPRDLVIAVNISPVQFRRPDLFQSVAGALASSRLSPARLELEVTETFMLHRNDATLSLLHRLRDLGVRISMDDFGTGYSSLSYLRSFAFNKIKIDQSFVRDIALRTDCEAIVRAISGLGLSLGITTTAEGVETAEQLAKVRAGGCIEVQGYLFSRPVSAKEVLTCLEKINGTAKAAAAAA